MWKGHGSGENHGSRFASAQHHRAEAIQEAESVSLVVKSSSVRLKGQQAAVRGTLAQQTLVTAFQRTTR